MKTFRVCFKNGERITIKAHGFEKQASGFIGFYQDDKKRDEDIYVFGPEVLYIVPLSGEATDEPSDSK
jgi:hypothetical protein